MLSLLVSTFKRVLSVDLSRSGDISRIQVVDTNHGIYFGMDCCGPFIFIAERNLDINQERVTPHSPVNVIRLYIKLPTGRTIRTPIRYRSEKFDDLHQITYDRAAIFVTSGKYPFLIRKNLLFGQRNIDITTVVPEEYRRHDDQDRDAYHINSVSTQNDHLFVLAHNWDSPSFALRLSLKKARKGEVLCTKQYKNLGSCCHDIVPFDKVFWTLDSANCALVRVDIETGAKDRFPMSAAPESIFDPSLGVPFPRGIDIFGDWLIMSYGFNEERADRMDSNSMLALFDLKQERFIKSLNLGNQGNTCVTMKLP